jgi:tRNA threonylcarbamoyladenosine biosynthesis protein TsaE
MDIRYGQEQTSDIASRILALAQEGRSGATIIALSGDLGAGKTTLAQAIGRALGVEEAMVSPTFVIAKFYPLSGQKYDRLAHVDAYRIESLGELAPLKWNSLIDDPRTLIVLEWPELIEGALPAQMLRFNIAHEGDTRHITSL